MKGRQCRDYYNQLNDAMQDKLSYLRTSFQRGYSAQQLLLIKGTSQYVKRFRILSSSGLPFPALRLNTERYSFCSVSVRIQPECGKRRTRITPNTDAMNNIYVSLKDQR